MKTWNVGIDENKSVVIQGRGGKFVVFKDDLQDLITELQYAQNLIPRITFPKPKAEVKRRTHLKLVK